MSKLRALCQLFVMAFREFAKREVYSESAKQQPPIRYDGDPTKIYLA